MFSRKKKRTPNPYAAEEQEEDSNEEIEVELSPAATNKMLEQKESDHDEDLEDIKKMLDLEEDERSKSESTRKSFFSGKFGMKSKRGNEEGKDEEEGGGGGEEDDVGKEEGGAEATTGPAVENEEAILREGRLHQRALEIGLLKGRVVWHHDDGCLGAIRDLLFFTTQYHPLISVFFAHPSHPFGWRERLLHLLATVFAAFFTSALTQVRHGGSDATEDDKMQWIIVSSIILTALDLVLREAATCGCVRPGGSCEGLCRCFGCSNDCVEIGTAFLGAATFVCFILCIVGIVLVSTTKAEDYDDDALETESPFAHFLLIWAITKAIVWASNLGVAVVLFLYYRGAEDKAYTEGGKHAAYPSGLDYPAPEFFDCSYVYFDCCVCEGEPSWGPDGRTRSLSDPVAEVTNSTKRGRKHFTRATTLTHVEEEFRTMTKIERRGLILSQVFRIEDEEEEGGGNAKKKKKKKTTTKKQPVPTSSPGADRGSGSGRKKPSPAARGGGGSGSKHRSSPGSGGGGGGGGGSGSAAKRLAERLRQDAADRRDRHPILEPKRQSMSTGFKRSLWG